MIECCLILFVATIISLGIRADNKFNKKYRETKERISCMRGQREGNQKDNNPLHSFRQ